MKRKASDEVSDRPVKAARMASEPAIPGNNDGVGKHNDYTPYLGPVDNAKASSENILDHSTANNGIDVLGRPPAGPVSNQVTGEDANNAQGAVPAATSREEHNVPKAAESSTKSASREALRTEETTTTQRTSEQADDEVHVRMQAEHDRAESVLRQMQLVVERWRTYATGLGPIAQEEKKQLQSLWRLTELASRPDTPSNPLLVEDLPYEWWAQMKGLKCSLDKTKILREDAEDCFRKIIKCSTAYDCALAALSGCLAGVTDGSAEAKQLHFAKAADARQELFDARKAHTKAEELAERHTRLDRSASEWPLRSAEELLIWKGYLLPLPGNDQDTSQKPQGAYRHRQRPRNASYAEEDDESEHEIRYDVRVDPYAPKPGENDRRRTHRPGDGRQDEDQAHTRLLTSPLAELQKGIARRLHEARDDRSEAEKDFHAVRKHYSRDLAKFLDDVDSGKAAGTKTDFDVGYFVRRNAANRELARCDEDWLHALAEAEKTGALTMGERAHFLGDAPEPQGPIDSFVADLLWWESIKRIEDWRNNEGLKEVASERHWQEMMPAEEYEGKTLASISGSEAGLAVGTYRTLIDSWQAQQEKTRATSQFLRQTSDAA